MGGIIAALLLSLLLSGCSAPPEEASAPSYAPASAPAAQVERMSSSMVESSSRPLPESEILASYERAQRVYGWFDLAPLPSSGQSVVLDGVTYYRVDMEGIRDLEDLRAYLRGVFSQELTDRLLDGRTARIQYRSSGGLLYVSGEARETDPGKGRIRVETERIEENLYFVNVMVDLLDEDGETVTGLESWSFPYAFVEDRWVFTDFRLVA